MVIYVEFHTWHWYFDLILNTTMLTAQVAMRVYIFHDRQFRSSVMSPFFGPHDPFNGINLDVVRPHFHPPMYPTDEETDFDPHLMPRYTIESNPTELSYPSLIQLTSDTSSSSESRVLGPRHGRGFIRTRWRAQ